MGHTGTRNPTWVGSSYMYMYSNRIIGGAIRIHTS
jgi:hypothetical protein